MDSYKISSTGVSINYMPEYIAESRGFFSEVGLKVETHVPESWTQVLADINSGEYDAVCGGIWVPNMYVSHNVNNYKAFAKVSSKCPYKLVSRSDDKFNWKDLEGKTVLIPSDGGASAYIFLIGTLKKKGVNVERVKFIHDFLNHMLVECFENGTLGDYIFTTAVSADSISDNEKGSIVSEMAIEGGDVPWSVYYTTEKAANDNQNLNKRFALALQKGIDFLLENDGEEFKDIIREKWPSANVKTSIETINRFKKEGMWSNSIEITKAEFDNYITYQLDAGIIDRTITLEEMVDREVLEYVNKQV